MKFFLLLLISTNLMAQNLPITPLSAPSDPIGNESTVDKVMHGKVLYWEEQMSSTFKASQGQAEILFNGSFED